MDLLNRVTTIVRADTSQAEAATKRLRGVERDRAKALLDDLNSQNDKLERQIATFTRIGVAVGAGIVIFKAAQAAAKAYLEDIRLESAAAGANIDRLREATKGLIETDTLLAFAGKAQHGVWKLNQEEMEVVLAGANALRIKMGVELQPTVEKLTESIAKGSTRALKEFGIEATDKAGALDALRGKVASLRGETSLTGDDFQRAGVKWADAVDDLQSEFGKLALQLSPVVAAFAAIAAQLAKIAGTVNDTPWLKEAALRAMTFGLSGVYSQMQDVAAPGLVARSVDMPTAEQTAARAASMTIEQRLAQMRARQSPSAMQLPTWVDEASLGRLATPKGLEWKEPKPEELLGHVANVGEFVTDTAAAIMGAAKLLIDATVEKSPTGGTHLHRELRGFRPLDEATASDDKFLAEWKAADISKGAKEAAAVADAAAKTAQERQRMSFAESIFGPVGQFSIYAKGFDMLTGAATAAFDAWITGGSSMADAVKKFVAESVRATALQMAVEAIKETAMGIAALASFAYPKAALHFKSAAMYGAGAVIAGVAAKQLGAGQSSTSSSASASSGASAPSAGSALGGGTGRTSAITEKSGGEVVIMLGRDFLGLTDLEQRQLVSRAIEQGLKGGTRTRNVRT